MPASQSRDTFALFFSATLLPLMLGVNLFLIKGGLEHGMKIPVYQVYKNVIAASFLIPSLWIRGATIQTYSTKARLMFYVLSLLEPVSSPFCYYKAMYNLSSKSFSCFTSLVPILTFGGALLFRLETININQRRSQIKLLGIIVMSAGSIVTGFYGGSALIVSSSPIEPLHLDANWERGLIYVVFYLISQVTYNILLAKIMEIIPDPFAIAGWTNLGAVFTNVFIALIMESRTRYSAFTLVPAQRIYIYLYGGVIIAFLATYIQARLTKQEGIMFLQSFSPLYVVCMIVLSRAFLGQRLVVGRIVGGLLMFSGLALLLLGRSEQMGPQIPQVLADNVENVGEDAARNMPIV